MKYDRRHASNLAHQGDWEALHDYLDGLRVAPCVIREWINSIRRRVNLRAKAAARAERKESSLFGQRGEPDRRIIAVRTVGNRRHSFHATKGWRVETVPA